MDPPSYLNVASFTPPPYLNVESFTPPPYSSKVLCCLCKTKGVSPKQSKRQYSLCSWCNNCYSSKGATFRTVLQYSLNNSSDFKMKLLDLFFQEFDKVYWFCGTPELSMRALYDCMFYTYTKSTSSDLKFIKAEQLRMKMSIDEWKKTIRVC